MMRTVWVLGDQLNRRIGALAGADPATDRVLLIESTSMLSGRPYHRQRLHLVLAAMRRFAGELRNAGFLVDYRKADSLARGLSDHRREYDPDEIVVTEPNGRAVDRLARRQDLRMVTSNQFLCHRDEFARWAEGRRQVRLEDFYRYQRRRLGYLMDDEDPAGGRWNFDHDNRQPPPSDGGDWPDPMSSRLDDIDRDVLSELPDGLPGAEPVGWWATSRRSALARLRHFIDEVLPAFGPHEDAMLADNWHLAHSLLSPSLNLGLLLPAEVCDAVEQAYRAGRVPINSAEGFIRQVIGWREFVWGLYWLWPEHELENVLGHNRSLPPAFEGTARTELRCLQVTLDGVEERGWVHHIQRLMVLGNIANLYGVEPMLLLRWMRERFVDAADWVMVANVIGMGLWADGGRMATKPYISGGAYLNRMSDYCRRCRFQPSSRSGDDACPLTVWYWDYLARHRELLSQNHRMARQYGTLDRLGDLPALRRTAADLISRFGRGEL
jgi:deoxyribodipyrimidine photolyase-related protein